MKRLLLSLAFVAAASPAFAADETPDAPPPTPRCVKDGAAVPDDYVQLARDVMTASKATDRATLMLDAMMPPMMQLVHKALPDLSDDAVTELQTAARDEMVRSLPALVSAEACIYVQHFSRDELAQLIAWYKSPMGQKLLAESPSIMKESFPLGKAWGEEAGRAAVERVIARYRKNGDKT